MKQKIVSIIFLCCLLSCFSDEVFFTDAFGQTISVGKRNYPIVDYYDNEANTLDDVLAAGTIEPNDYKSFKLKVLSKRRLRYTDSYGTRINCADNPTYARCIDKYYGEDYVVTSTFTFRFNPRKKLVSCVFEYYYEFNDGSYSYSNYSGISRYSVSR